MAQFTKTPNETYADLEEQFWAGKLDPETELAFLLAAHYKKKAELALEGLENAVLVAASLDKIGAFLSCFASQAKEYVEAVKSDFWGSKP